MHLKGQLGFSSPASSQKAILSFWLFKDVSMLLWLMGSEAACGKRAEKKHTQGGHRVIVAQNVDNNI